MSLTDYISAAKDLLIVAAVAFLVWLLYHSGANSVRVSDIEALRTQLTKNAQLEEKWREEVGDAFAEQNSQMGAVLHAIDVNRQPVIVRFAPRSGAVSGTSPGPASSPPEAGGGNSVPGTDIRPALNAYEEWAEQNFATCRALKEAWPH